MEKRKPPPPPYPGLKRSEYTSDQIGLNQIPESQHTLCTFQFQSTNRPYSCFIPFTPCNKIEENVA